jgi:hypothetical protein
MKIKAYFLFPTTDNDFIRIGDNPQSYKSLVEEVAVIKQQLKAHKDFELCYDSENVNLFLTKAESLIEEKYLADCRTQLQILFNSFSRNVSSTVLRKADCIYVNWNINYSIADASRLIAEASEAKLNEGQDKTILINISNAYINSRDSVHVIKDAIHYNELPQLVSIPVANNEIEFSEWHITLTTPAFSLKDKTRFEATAHKWNKQKIYKDKNTGNYWYYDYFHNENKKHFEVFNSVGVHLGEANTEGVLDFGKATNEKRIDDIIQ